MVLEGIPRNMPLETLCLALSILNLKILVISDSETADVLEVVKVLSPDVSVGKVLEELELDCILMTRMVLMLEFLDILSDRRVPVLSSREWRNIYCWYHLNNCLRRSWLNRREERQERRISSFQMISCRKF